jgi:hypothetical protein
MPLYALKTVTKIEAGRVGDGITYQTVVDGDPIVELAYFQTACGPGTALIDPPNPPPPPGPGVPPKAGEQPRPAVTPVYLDLASDLPPSGAVPPTVGNATALFPRGGQLLDLHTYLQWSWPADGESAAYYGYDVNVEFNETYVNKLYTALSNGNLLNSLHFRCVDRNQLHVALVPAAIRVPSAYWQSALVAYWTPQPLPQSVVSLLPSTLVLLPGSLQRLADALQRLTAATPSRQLPPPAAAALRSPGALLLRANVLQILKQLAGLSNIVVNPGAVENLGLLDRPTASVIQHLIAEEIAAEKVRDLWPESLQPSTRYTLVVVAGPFDRGLRAAAVDSFSGIYAAPDAIGALQALKNYYTFEDSLSTLARVQLATSRYATFTDQLASAVAQSAVAATRMRRYPAPTDPQAWLADAINNDIARRKAQSDYVDARAALAAFFAKFDPTADDLPPGLPRLGNRDASSAGESGLLVQRGLTQTAWQAFADATAASFDGLIAALDRSDLTSTQHAAPPPETEISFFVDASDGVVGRLLESPEPLRWQRLWQSTSLTPGVLSASLTGAWMAPEPC